MSKKGLYEVTSGDSHYVRANSQDEAEAIYMVALGYMDKEDYPDFDITDEDLESLEEGETTTIVEFIHE
jgi:hypothetical protein